MFFKTPESLATVKEDFNSSSLPIISLWTLTRVFLGFCCKTSFRAGERAQCVKVFASQLAARSLVSATQVKKPDVVAHICNSRTLAEGWEIETGKSADNLLVPSCLLA